MLDVLVCRDTFDHDPRPFVALFVSVERQQLTLHALLVLKIHEEEVLVDHAHGARALNIADERRVRTEREEVEYVRPDERHGVFDALLVLGSAELVWNERHGVDYTLSAICVFKHVLGAGLDKLFG